MAGESCLAASIVPTPLLIHWRSCNPLTSCHPLGSRGTSQLLTNQQFSFSKKLLHPLILARFDDDQPSWTMLRLNFDSPPFFSPINRRELFRSFSYQLISGIFVSAMGWQRFVVFYLKFFKFIPRINCLYKFILFRKCIKNISLFLHFRKIIFTDW